jgi:hypothetical protein
VDGGVSAHFMDKYCRATRLAKAWASLKRVAARAYRAELRERIQKLSWTFFNNMDCKGRAHRLYVRSRQRRTLHYRKQHHPGSLALPVGALRRALPQVIDEMVACAWRAREKNDESNYAFTSDI